MKDFSVHGKKYFFAQNLAPHSTSIIAYLYVCKQLNCIQTFCITYSVKCFFVYCL